MPTSFSAASRKELKRPTRSAKQKGWTPFHVIGWSRPPFFDDQTKNLTWGIIGAEDNDKGQTINYSVRLLGRRGTMKVELLAAPEQMDAALPQFNSLISGFTYNQGSRYAEFTKGDKVATYGLTALIAGGVGAAAVKTGLLAKLLAALAALWKVIAVALAGVLARLKKILAWFKEKLGGEKKPDSATSPTGLSSDAPPRELGPGRDSDHDDLP